MNKAVTTVLFWTIVICLLIALIVPKSPVALYAIHALIAAIAMLAVLSVFELIFVFVRTTPSPTWKPGNSDQAEGRLYKGDPDEED